MGDRNPLLIGVVAICALGVGITGTMLWMQDRTPSSVPAPSTSTASNTALAPSVAAAPALPPASQASSAEAALKLGNDFYDSNQWIRAIAQYRLALSGGIDTPDLRTDLGNALRFSGHPQEALDQYKIAQTQDPNHEQSLFNQGGLWAFALHDPVKGVEAWKTYLKRFPNGQSAKEARQFIKQNEGKSPGSRA